MGVLTRDGKMVGTSTSRTGREGLPVISMSEETPDNLCIAFLDLFYCRPIASLIQVLIS